MTEDNWFRDQVLGESQEPAGESEQPACMLTPEAFRAFCRTQQSVYAIVTPNFAQYVLDHHNESSIDPPRVKRYRDYIENGIWISRMSAIHIDLGGQLHNGQHRLKAIAEAGIPVKVRFEFGMAEEVRDFYDLKSAARSAADVLLNHGVSVKGAATILSQFMSYMDGQRVKLEPGMYEDALERFPQFKQNLMLADDIIKPVKSDLEGPATWYYTAVVILLEVGHSPERVKQFIHGLVPTPEAQDPALFYCAKSAEAGKATEATEQGVQIILNGWNKWVRHDTVTRCQVKVNVPLSKLVKPARALTVA